MSKHGFNENELRKTITVMVDKDGFHKEVVSYGKPEPAHIVTGIASNANEVAGGTFDITLLTLNVPEDASVYFKEFETDDEYEFEVGDEIENSDLLTYTEADTEFSDIGAVMGIDSAVEGGAKVYYQVYATDDNNIVLDRTKTEVDLS